MKGKTLLSLAIVLSMVLAALPLMAVKASPTTVAVVFENGLNKIKKAPCDNFVVSLVITGAPDMDFWDMEIHWDPAVLELQTGTVGDLVEGGFMKASGSTIFVSKDPDNVAGILPDIACGFLSGGPASGDGVLCTIAFHAKAQGNSSITIWLPGEESYLLLGQTVVPFDVVNGIVEVPPPPATPPNAEFTPADGTFVDVCTDVILDGSTSRDGYDTTPPPGETCPITIWKWDIDFHNGTIRELYGETASFHCDGPGLVTITLTVTAPDPTLPSSPDYVDHNSETHTIMQITPAVGPKIDVYTERGGTGPGMMPDGSCMPYPLGWSDAFGPQEEVTVYAKVTYNDEPLEYKPVAFEMVDPTQSGRDFRTAFTDANGIATTSFRIPWEGSDAEDLFGDWCIVATVSVSEVEVMDKVCFRFGYIISIRGITVTGSPLYKLDTMTIDVDLQSISMSSHNVLVTIVACDECNVPIGLAYTDFTVDPEDGMLLGQTITIPSWAFVGTGTIYANVFTTYPWIGGVPYCPERSTIFIILKTP